MADKVGRVFTSEMTMGVRAFFLFATLSDGRAARFVFEASGRPPIGTSGLSGAKEREPIGERGAFLLYPTARSILHQ